jgi:glycosyltransferase involved in cell wall biosynthesis
MSKLDIDFLLLTIGLNKPDKNFLDAEELKEMSLLKEQGNRLLKDKIFFIDPVKETNIFMQMADLLILNSENEGMPNVILEAMASGLPVLWKKLPGISDVIIRNEINGFIYSTMDEFLNKISFILKNKNILAEIGINARRFAEKELSFEILFKKLQKLLYNN